MEDIDIVAERDKLKAENEYLRKRVAVLTEQILNFSSRQFEYEQDYLPYEEDNHDR